MKKRLLKRAEREGFDVAGVCSPKAMKGIKEKLQFFLEQGFHGDMEWLAEKPEVRSHPNEMWADVKSVLVVGQNYAPEENPLHALEKKDKGVISVYAHGEDYHEVLKKKLKSLAQWLVKETNAPLKVFVDTAPVMEKPLAMAAGLGWQGKHTNLVSREYGSWLFLGVIYLTIDLTPDIKEKDHCGNCTRCLDICPTKAFPKPYQLDARRCISYLTIEHKGIIPDDLKEMMGNRIYGCDDCLAVCPWNKFAKDAEEIRLKNRSDIATRPLEELLTLNDENFRILFRKTPIKRIGHKKFIRNVLIAAGNSKKKTLTEKIIPYINDENEAVKDAAAWAFDKLQKIKS